MDKYNSRCTIKNTSFFSTFVLRNKNGKWRPSIRALRYAAVFLVHLLFVLSFRADIQILEGDISGSRILGFHLADPFATLEVIAAHKDLPINLLIGSGTILLFYFIAGGKAFCSWICPYGALSEIGEKLHNTLIAKHVIKERTLPRGMRYAIWAAFLVLSAITDLLVFEIFNVVGILSRFIIYGFSLAGLWIVFVFLLEVFFSRRAWCTHLCPLGSTYSLAAKASLSKITWDKSRCDHCGVCQDVCFVSHVLDITKKKASENLGDKSKFMLKGIDCTLCGRCIDVCHQDALSIGNKLKDMI